MISRVNITLHLIRLKMKPNKSIFATAFCFVFTKRKMLLMHTELFVKRMMKML